MWGRTLLAGYAGGLALFVMDTVSHGCCSCCVQLCPRPSVVLNGA